MVTRWLVSNTPSAVRRAMTRGTEAAGSADQLGTLRKGDAAQHSHDTVVPRRDSDRLNASFAGITLHGS